MIARGGEDIQSLDWGVGPACGACDWLAYPDYLSRTQCEQMEAGPHVYCFQRAQQTDHLSRLPFLTRGARKVMDLSGLGTVAQVAGTTGEEGVYRTHNRLQADRTAIPAHAAAIVSGETSLDPDRRDGLLARYADLDVFMSVNFDVGAGLVTGIATSIRFDQHRRFGAPRTENGRRRITRRWVTMGKDAAAERQTLLAFLRELSDIFEHAYSQDDARGGADARRTTAQLVFWSERQFEELCLAVGRHLPSILFDRDNSRAMRSLAWLFPPEELQEKDNVSPTSPVIAFAQRTLRRLVRTPAEHAMTLFRVAEHYRREHADFPWRAPDSFYAEPFSDSIPRERIYEIWRIVESGGRAEVRWGTRPKTLNDLTDGFNQALTKQVRALQQIVYRIRADFGGRLRADGEVLSLTIPNWTTGVAQDSKLFIGWAQFEAAYSRAAAFNRYFRDPDEVEASHDGVRLERLVEERADGALCYEVSEASLNSKLKAPDDYLVVSWDAEPGFLSLRAGDLLGWTNVAPEERNWRMDLIFSASLLEFDRSLRRAVIRFDNGRGGDARRLRNQVIRACRIDLGGGLTLTRKSSSSIQVRRLRDILQAVGNPAIAAAAPETAGALGTDRLAR